MTKNSLISSILPRPYLLTVQSV